MSTATARNTATDCKFKTHCVSVFTARTFSSDTTIFFPKLIFDPFMLRICVQRALLLMSCYRSLCIDMLFFGSQIILSVLQKSSRIQSVWASNPFRTFLACKKIEPTGGSYIYNIILLHNINISIYIYIICIECPSLSL